LLAYLINKKENEKKLREMSMNLNPSVMLNIFKCLTNQIALFENTVGGAGAN